MTPPPRPTPQPAALDLQQIFEQVTDGIVVFDRDWNYLLVNARGAEVVGRRADELVGRNLRDVFPELLSSPFYVAYERAMRSGESSVFEGYHEPWDRWFETRLYPGGHGLTILFSDISARKRAEVELERRRHEFEALAENSPDVIARYDRDLRVLYVNPAIERVTGRPSSHYIGYAVHEVGLPPEIVAGWTGALLRAFAGEEHEMEYRFPSPDGVERHLNARLTPERAPDDTVQTVLVSTRDVTAQRSAEQALRQAQRLESIGRLAGGIAHDFNNVLAAILGHADLLLADLPPRGSAHDDASEIRRSAQRAAELTRQLLAFSRHQVLQLRTVDLAAVVGDAERMLRRLLPADMVFELLAGDAPWWVHADPGQLEQVLMNLVINARDAIDARGPMATRGGIISMRITACTAGRDGRILPLLPGAPLPVPASPLAPGDYVALCVTDTGVGMDATTRARALEPFFTTKPPGVGTGLGLATVHGIAAQTGGAVALASMPGAGTTICVYLPRAGAPAGADLAGVERPASPPGTPRPRTVVLVVEDEAAVRASTCRILASGGYQVLEARHGADALRLWEEERAAGRQVDLVVTDLVMPEMPGAEFARRLRERAPDARVLVVSGYAAESMREEVGGTAFLEKPFTADELLTAVRGVLKA